MRDPYTSLAAPIELSRSLEPLPGQLQLPIRAAGYCPPPALSSTYPYLPTEATA